MTAACCGGIGMCIDVLCEAGKNLLAPSPGFGLYKCLCEARGANIKLYKLLVRVPTCTLYVSVVREIEEGRKGERNFLVSYAAREKLGG